jgi:hypothetical protein
MLGRRIWHSGSRRNTVARVSFHAAVAVRVVPGRCWNLPTWLVCTVQRDPPPCTNVLQPMAEHVFGALGVIGATFAKMIWTVVSVAARWHCRGLPAWPRAATRRHS